MSTEVTARPALFRPSPLVARAFSTFRMFASDDREAAAWALAIVVAGQLHWSDTFEQRAAQGLATALLVGDLARAEKCALGIVDPAAAMDQLVAEVRAEEAAKKAAAELLATSCPACQPDATGRFCAEHLAAIDALADTLRPAIAEMVRETVEALTEEPAPRFVECPRCEGHGDVPGEFHRHNPTGLVECPVCRGEREVPNPAYEAEAPATNDNAALAQADAIDGALTMWGEHLDGDLTLDASLPCEHGYEVAS